ncbi:MAG: hypothetical protein RL748_2804 [Pseudomonadota bacterium]
MAEQFIGLNNVPLQMRGMVADGMWQMLKKQGFDITQLDRLKGMLDIWAHRRKAVLQPLQQVKDDLFWPDLEHDTAWFDNSLFPISADMEAAYPELLEELKMLQGRNMFAHYGAAKPGDPALAGNPIGWKQFSLLEGSNIFHKKNCELAPVAARIAQLAIEKNAAVLQVSYLTLGPGDVLAPHVDIGNFLTSCHLGLEVPENCALKVGSEERPWINGKCITFNNSYIHSAYNRSNVVRYTFIVHALHPDLTPVEKQAVKFLITTVAKGGF